MTKIIALFSLITLCWRPVNEINKTADYTIYHQRVIDVETLIASENYKAALDVYEALFGEYEFVFLRDYQIATQLALFLDDEEKAKEFLIKGIKSGWTMKSIKKNKFLDGLRKSESWKSVKEQYPKLHKEYESSLNQEARERVRKMFKKDQKKAFGALFRFSAKAQDRYAEQKFAPHSEKQIRDFLEILTKYGYPGEKLIGNEVWMSTILSHHNSISTNYNTKDTLYQNFKPKLTKALKKGEISAFSYAMIEEWYRSVVDNKSLLTYGILDGPLKKDLAETNKLRATVFLRSIEIHNKLVDVEEKTGMNFYLEGHPWDKGKIEIK